MSLRSVVGTMVMGHAACLAMVSCNSYLLICPGPLWALWRPPGAPLLRVVPLLGSPA